MKTKLFVVLTVFLLAPVAHAQKVGRLDRPHEIRMLRTFYQPSSGNVDAADLAAANFFLEKTNGLEHMLVYDGEIRDVSSLSYPDEVWADTRTYKQIADAGKPAIFFHNHVGTNVGFIFPTDRDFKWAAFAEYEIRKFNSLVPVEFRIIVINKGVTSVSFGFKQPILQTIHSAAKTYREYESLRSVVEKLEADQLYFREDVGIAVSKVYIHYWSGITKPPAVFGDIAPKYFRWPNGDTFVNYRGAVVVDKMYGRR